MQAAIIIGPYGREGQAPLVIEMPFYQAGADGPVFQEFCARPATPSISIELANAAYGRKRRMLACHWTQRDVLTPFVFRHERFVSLRLTTFALCRMADAFITRHCRLASPAPTGCNPARHATKVLGLERR
jgi:hypothetical protein